MEIHDIRIAPKVFSYCKKRQLNEQLKKAINSLKSGDTKSILLKPLRPKYLKIYQFRINKQFRVTGKIIDGVFYIDSVHNHQN